MAASVTSAPVEFPHDAAAGEDQHPVAQAFQLDAVGGRHQHRHAAIGDGAHALIDLAARADIDALGRLVDQQDAGLRRDLAAEQRFLLIAAGQFVELGFARGGADAQILDDGLGALGLLGMVDDAMARDRAEKAQAEILAQRQIEEDAFGVAVVGDEADAGVAECAGPLARDRHVLDADLAAVAAIDAGRGADELALALALDTGQADDLAGMDDEIDLVEAAAAQSVDGKDRRANRRRLGRKDLAERPAGDQRDDLGRRDRVRRPAVDDLAVAHHRDAVGQFVDLVQPVGDIDDGDAVALEFADQLEQLAHVGVLQRLGRLVEEQNLRFGGERAGDLDDVALRQRQFGDAPVHRHAQFGGGDAPKEPLGLGGAAGGGELRRGKLQVFQDGQVRRERRVLIDDGDAVFQHQARARRLDILAVVIDRAGVGPQHAGGNGDQRRFAGAVLADDGMNFAGHDQNVDAFERLHRAEALAHGGERHDRDVRRGDRLGGGNDVMHSAAAG